MKLTPKFTSTLISDRSCCALAAVGSTQLGATGLAAQNYSTCFIGNSVYGGRMGERGNPCSTPFTLNFSGNDLTLYPPFDQYGDLPGAAVEVQGFQSVSVCGNALHAGGHGLLFTASCGAALVLNNDFGCAAYSGIGYEDGGDSLNTAQIYGNRLGEGVSFHVQLPYTNSFGWFLGNNTYLNTSSNIVPPFLDPASSAVHIFN